MVCAYDLRQLVHIVNMFFGEFIFNILRVCIGFLSILHIVYCSMEYVLRVPVV